MLMPQANKFCKKNEEIEALLKNVLLKKINPWQILKMFYRKNRELEVLIELFGDGKIGAFTTHEPLLPLLENFKFLNIFFGKKQKRKTKSLKALSIYLFFLKNKTNL